MIDRRRGVAGSFGPNWPQAAICHLSSVICHFRGLRRNADVPRPASHQRVRRHTAHQKHVCANGGSCSDHGFTAKDRRIGIDSNPIFNIGMAFPTFLNPSFLILLKAASAQSYPVIQLHPVPDFAGLTDDNPGSMVDEKVRSDFSAGVDVDPGPAMCPLGHNSGDQGQFFEVKYMSRALDGDGFDARIT